MRLIAGILRGAVADARAPRLVTALLVGALALQAYLLVGEARGILAGAPARGPRSHAGYSYASAAQAIVSAHLFGAPPVEAAAGDGPSSLQLTLVGTLATEDPAKGVAIIRSADNKAHTVAASEQIDASTRLMRVYVDRAVVDFRGSEQVLVFPRSQQLLALLSQPAALRTSGEAAPVPRDDGLAKRPPPPPHTANYAAIMDNIDYNAHMVGNQIGGIEISSVKDEEALRKLGLREGDVVTSMNGEPINSMTRINELLKALSDGEPVNATVVRDGKTTTATPTSE